MHDRSALGPADVSDEELARMVATLWDTDPSEVELLSSEVVPVDYDLPTITTAARHRVRGRARRAGVEADYSLFVKHLQCWSRSPEFAQVPPEIRDFAAAGVPWRTEALVYRSDLAERLPDGLRMPRAVGVHDLDERSAAVWLADLAVVDVEWDLDRYQRAAYLLGRLAGSPTVAPYAGVGEFPWSVRTYAEGRLAHQVIPMLNVDAIWAHPLVAGAFDDELRARLLAAAGRVDEVATELAGYPITAAHGDACPNNLLVSDPTDDGFILIDFGFWMPLPVGFDLGQLLVGDVQIGRRNTSDLAKRDEACLDAYVDGLRAEGSGVDIDEVRRAHALHLLLFTGLSTVPFEYLEAEPTPRLRAMIADRAAIAHYSLDLLDATG